MTFPSSVFGSCWSLHSGKAEDVKNFYLKARLHDVSHDKLGRKNRAWTLTHVDKLSEVSLVTSAEIHFSK